MKIFFINPPFKKEFGKFSREQRSPAITKSGTFYYPMWLSYAAGYSDLKGHECHVIDAPASGLEYDEIVTAAKKIKPDIIIVDTSTPSIFSDIEFSQKIKDEIEECFIILVGTHPSALPFDVLNINKKIDAVICGEYEKVLSEFAEISKNKWKDKNELIKIKGLIFRIGDEIYGEKTLNFIEDIDEIPFVSKTYKKFLNHKDYFYGHSKYPIITILTARGCPHQCVYCVYPQVFNSRQVRYRSINNVVDEIEYILKNFPDVKEIMFEDDTLTINKKRAIEFAEEISRRKLKFQWSANSRADVDMETLKVLKRSGARLFCVGVESGDQTVLDNMKKNLKIEKIQQFFSDAKKAGILIHGCFLVGNPGETKDTLKKTLDFAKQLNPDTAQFFPIMVYPGTEAYTWAKENDFLVTEEYDRWLTEGGMHNCVLSRPGLTNKELVDFCDKARKEFYLRPSYILHKLAMSFKDFYEFKRLVKGAFHLFKHILKKDKNDICNNTGL